MIRSSEADKTFNLYIFVGLIKELRIKLQIFQAGFGPQKSMQLIKLGSAGSKKMDSKKRLKVIAKLVLREFSMINVSRVREALSNEPVNK